MSRNKFSDFYKFYNELIADYQQKAYDKVLNRLDEEGGEFPDMEWALRYLQADIAACRGEDGLALTILDGMMAEGLWMPDPAWDDRVFDKLREQKGFQDLRQKSDVLRQQAQSGTFPEMLVSVPTQTEDRNIPLLIAMHGNNSTNEAIADYYRPAVSWGWLLALPRSSRVFSPGAYSWYRGDVELAEQEIRDHISTLKKAYRIDTSRVAISGFSLGGELAILLALQHEAKGFIAIAPGGPRMRDVSLWEPWIEKAKGTGLRGCILLGEQDNPDLVSGTRKLVDRLNQLGIDCRMDSFPVLAHEYPEDFPVRLKKMLDFITG
jgi:predicted esterase